MIKVATSAAPDSALPREPEPIAGPVFGPIACFTCARPLPQNDCFCMGEADGRRSRARSAALAHAISRGVPADAAMSAMAEAMAEEIERRIRAGRHAG